MGEQTISLHITQYTPYLAKHRKDMNNWTRDEQNAAQCIAMILNRNIEVD